MRIRFILPLLLTLSACGGVDAAPKDLDGLIHFLWQQYEEGEDESLIDALRNVHQALDVPSLEDPIDGTITALDQEESALVGLESARVADAQGLFMARTFDCTLSKLDRLLYDLGQDQAHPDAYDTYTRTYTSDIEAYKAREDPFVSWEVDYVTSLTGTTYSSHIIGGLRYIPDIDDGDELSGPALLARTYMPGPAEFETDSEYSLDQDYQIELFYQSRKSRIVHLYGLWRQGVFTFGWDMSNEYAQRLILDSMSDWDDETVEVCR